MKRGIEESSDSETMSTTVNPQYQQYQLQQQQQQQQQQASSTSPLSNSSSNSSSCLTNNSFSSAATSPYSPLQLGQPLVYATAGLPTHPNQIILTLPAPNQAQQLNSLVSLANNSSPTSNSSTNTGNNQTAANQNGASSATNNQTATNGTIDNQNLNLTLAQPVFTAYNPSLAKPEAKKAKTQRTQPSKVVHIRNIPQQITEIEIIQFGLIFGNIANVLNLRSKCQAFLEFEKCEEAQSMINYFANNPISVAGRQIFVQYSNYKNLVTDPSNTNNQVARAALDLAKDLHKAAQTGGQNTVLRAMIQNMLYAVTLDTIYQIFNRYGPVLKIITFTKNDKFQALIQMKDATSAQAAKTGLHGQNIYNSCCTLHIDYSKLNTLNVKYNNEKSRDYTNPLLPAGDCPDHLVLGPGGIINAPMQLSMAAAAAGYSPFATTIPAGYHIAPAGNPFLSFPGKYLPQQTLINASSLLQPTGANLTTATLSQAAIPGQAASQNAAAAAAAAYAMNHHTMQHQQTAHQTGATATNTNGQQNNIGQTATTVNGINGTMPANAIAPNTHVTTASGHMLFPLLQNLSDEGYMYVYTT